ncbi:hypothetical protein CAPTEDRAFT_206365 [Capitella teleta]|uniref:Amidohydrolase 3 domain-containing protein n=1 Tax=Capitella teleta TaxID=283909 RepID=R7UC45_CAPTE|nr:hypothetical protein CAPTEDRAFT_206365 [Capitella teleta]|eukprot:ELU03691.1 hypothetical protein CAPTEDRAFT_206365 [Capitella teleta]
MTDVLVVNAQIWSGKIGGDFSWMRYNPSSGYITEVGRGAPPPKETATKVKDFHGKRIFPGFHESHLHLGHLGNLLCSLDLHGCNSIEKLQTKLQDYMAKNPSGWVVGNNWEQDVLGRYPTKEDLDAVSGDRPVFLHRVCHHIGIGNSKALQLAGVGKDTPDPDGGAVDRYPSEHPKAGEPTGILRENACKAIRELTRPNSAQVTEHLGIALAQCIRNGVTSAHSCEVQSWNEFKSLVDSSRLPIRIFYSAFYDSKDSGNFPKAGEKHGDLLSCDRIKLFSDGALGVGTAFLSQPYRGRAERGIPLHTEEELLRLVKEATASGYRLEVHAIGDAAAEMVIEAMEKADVTPEKRPILTHCQILRKELIPRMKSLGMIANIQPQFVPTDARWVDRFLPDGLMDCIYPWKTLTDAGIMCAGGSDAPVEHATPLQGIYDAIFRPSGRDEEGNRIPFKSVIYISFKSEDNTGADFRSDEKLSVTEAIDLYTKNGAYATLEEHRLGQIRPGYFADFVVIDSEKDVVDFPEYFQKATVADVYVAGQPKFS